MRDFTDVLVTLKNEEDQIKNEGTRVFTTMIFRRSRAGNSVVSGRICVKFEFIKAFMHVLVSCRNEEDQIKGGGASVFIT